MNAADELPRDIARLNRMSPRELAQETGRAELAEAEALRPESPEDLAYRAELEKRAR